MPGRDVAGFEQEIDRRRMAAPALRIVAEGLGIPAAFRMPLHAERRDDRGGIHACVHRAQKSSLRLRISANTSTSAAFSMPRFLRITGSCQRRNGLVDSSSADRGGQRRLAVGAQPVDLGGALLQRRIGGVDGQRKAGIGLRVFVAAIDLGLERQRRQLLQRFEHHRRLAFEQPAAAQRKQRVGGKKRCPNPERR